MARTFQYRTSDVFTSTAYKGNQLGIITIPATSPLSQSEKQAIANEFNYSESIFVHSPSARDQAVSSSPPRVKVDIFTTDRELPFAGHPTIGAIHHILTHIYPDESSVIVDLKAGPVVGMLNRETGFASAEIPQEFHEHSAGVRWADVLASQPGLQGEMEQNKDGESVQTSKHALVSIVRGMNFGLVNLSKQPKLLGKLKVSNKEVAEGTDLDEGWPATLVGSLFYIRGTSHYRRCPWDGKEQFMIGVDQRVIVIGLEDPATGSASCALAAYLALERSGEAEEGPEGPVYRFELVQGEEMGRKSVIGVEVNLEKSGKKVTKVVLFGQCTSVMKGELEI